MSVSMEGQGASQGCGGSQDFDLNLAPIIDCLTVLITFMLASASFLSIGILDAGVAAAGATAATDQAPPVNVAIELGSNQDVVIKVTGKESATLSVPHAASSSSPDYDYAGLTRQLASLQAKWPSVKAVTLSASNTVEYRNVVKAMDVVRKTMPVVLLGGF